MKSLRPVASLILLGVGSFLLLAAADLRADAKADDEPVPSTRLYEIDATSGRVHAAIWADESCYITGEGWTKEAGSWLWLWRIDTAGNLLWKKEIVARDHYAIGPDAVAILPRPSESDTKSAGGVDIVVRGMASTKMLSVDSAGDVGPTHVLIKDRQAHGAIALPDGDLVLFGEDWSEKREGSWIARVSRTGASRWQKNFDASAAKWSEKIQAARQQKAPKGFYRSDFLQEATLLADGSIVLVGQTGEFNKFGQGPTKLWLLKIDGDGNKLAEAFIDDGNTFRGTQDVIAPAGDGVVLTYSLDQLPPIVGAPHNFPAGGFQARLIRCNAKLEKQEETLLPGTSFLGASITGPTPYIAVTSLANSGKEQVIIQGMTEDGKELWTSRAKYSEASVRPFTTLRCGEELLVICNYASHLKEDQKHRDKVLIIKSRAPAKN